MAQELKSPRRRGLFSLSLRVSVGLVLAAIIPLLITLGFTEWRTRPALTEQASIAMQSDAENRVKLIDTYLQERSLDAEALVQVPSVQEFLAAPRPPTTPVSTYKVLSIHAGYALAAGIHRDTNYSTWALFDTKGEPLLAFGEKLAQHGKYVVPPGDKARVLAQERFISPVYYLPTTNTAFIDIYAPVMKTQASQTTTKPAMLGFMRATLKLDYVWNTVSSDKNANGSGSSAFILDDNGVRIADTDKKRLFKSVAPINQDIQQQMNEEERFGTSAAVVVVKDTTLANTLNATKVTTFQTQPVGEQERYQIVQHPLSKVPWHYFVLSPVSTVTATADQQLRVTVLVALIMSTLVALLGLLTGQNITRPILVSVENLRDNSTALNTLSQQQKDTASEQMWVVDSSQVGLRSIQYYTDAIKVAAQRLQDNANTLARSWQNHDATRLASSLERILEAARYIEDATEYQNNSNQKLATALKVATQVTEQLASGAASNSKAAEQLEEVVQQLRQVVGR